MQAPDLQASSKNPNVSLPESQTQLDTQISAQEDTERDVASFSKRKSENEASRTNSKRIKISIGSGINLED